MKRLIDILGSSAALVVLSPLILAAAMLVRWRMGAPILFVQERPGLRGRPFQMLKFRTMTNAEDADGKPLPSDQRLTPFGRLLRSTSIDELPSLWNVLRGDMSLVGPRPLLMRYLGLYTTEQARRHYVRPGLTGWAQVNGRNAVSWDERFRMDVWYVDNRTLLLDLRIILKTIIFVLKRAGINSKDGKIMEQFKGSEK